MKLQPSILAVIRKALWANRVPWAFLNVLVAGIVWSYYQQPRMADLWLQVADFRTRWGFAFSFFATIIAAALLPSAIQMLSGQWPKRLPWRRLLALVAFWGYRGVEIDLLYQLQAMLFGPSDDWQTLAAKVAVDQFVYSALWGVPTYAVVLRWIDHDCSWSRTVPSLDREFWTRTCPTVLVTNWVIWLPTVALVYSLPIPLQFPLFSLVMCFFVLVVTLAARKRPQGDATLP